MVASEVSNSALANRQHFVLHCKSKWLVSVWNTNQMTGFCMEYITGLKWVDIARYSFISLAWSSRSSRSQMFFKISFLKNFTMFTGKHLCWSLFLVKLQSLQHGCFPVNTLKFLRTAFLIEHPRWRLAWTLSPSGKMC